MPQLQCLPYCCSLGSSVAGHEEAPHALYCAAQQAAIPYVEWHENCKMPYRHAVVPPLGHALRLEQVTAACKWLAEEVERTCRQGHVPVSIGGDHSMSIGSVAGFAQAYPDAIIGLLWVDAHLDANTPATSPSQAIHGMPLAALLGYGHAPLTAIGSRKAKIEPQHVCMVGSRAADAAELKFLQTQGVTVFPMSQIHAEGLPSVLAKAWEVISNGTTKRYLSLDIDSVDPADAPGVGLPEAEGIAGRAMLEDLQMLMQQGGFDGYDIAEYHPANDIDGKTAQLVMEIMRVITDGASR